MSKYNFNPERCKAAIEGLSKMVYDNGYTAIPTRDKVLLGVILDDLILDIEALHAAAQERDEVLDTVLDMTYGSHDSLADVYDLYCDDDGDLNRIADLNL
jgi:hypothetical protein